MSATGTAESSCPRIRYLSPLLAVLVFIVVFLKPNPEERILLRLADGMILGTALFFLWINLDSLRRFSWAQVKVFQGAGLIFLGMLFTMAIQRLLGTRFSFRDMLEMYRPFLFFFLFSLGWYSAGRLQVKWIMRLLALFLLFQVVVGFLQLYNIGGFNSSPFNLIWSTHKVKPWQGRIVGTLGNPNEYGYVLNMLMMLFYFYLFRGRPGQLLGKSLFLLVHGFLIVFSSSRTGLVVWACFSGWESYLLLRKSGALLRIVALSAVGLLALLGFIFWEQILKLLQAFWYVYQTLDTLMKNQSFWEIKQVKSRLVNYQLLYDMIRQSPLIGIGPQKDLIRIGDNDYLFCWAQWGILGMVLKYCLFIQIARMLRAVRSPEVQPMAEALFFAVLALFIGGLTVESFNNLKYVPMILLLAGFALSKDHQWRQALGQQ